MNVNPMIKKYIKTHDELKKKDKNDENTYIIAANHGNTGCMFYLAMHFGKINDNLNMLKYLIMASENGLHVATEMLAIYYSKTKNQQKEAICLEKLYESGDLNYDIAYSGRGKNFNGRQSVVKLINYYSSKEHYQKDNLIKYLKIHSDDFKNGISAYKLGEIYELEKNYPLAQKYYQDAYFRDNINAFYPLLRIDKYISDQSQSWFTKNIYGSESTICRLNCAVL